MKKILYIVIMLCFLSACSPFESSISIPFWNSKSSSSSNSSGSSYSHDIKTETGSFYTSLNARANAHLPKGKTYTVWGKDYTPYTSAHGFAEVGVASWYGPGFHGNTTSNMEIYNQYAMTAAHKLLPFGTKVRVTNLENNKSCIVRINDRGPFLHGRIIDLSKKAAGAIDMLDSGTAKVHLTVVNDARSASNSVISQYLYSITQTAYSTKHTANSYAHHVDNSWFEKQPVAIKQYGIHLGAYSNMKNVLNTRNALEGMGIPSFIRQKGKEIKLYAGPFKSTVEARKARVKITHYFPNAYYVQF